MQNNGWIALIKHCTYISGYLAVGSCLIVITGKLKEPKMSNVALGVPIEQSKLIPFNLIFFQSVVLLIHSSTLRA